MKALLITKNFLPTLGGMERMNTQIAWQLARSFELALIAPEGSTPHAPPDGDTREVPLRPLWRFFLEATRATLHYRTAPPDMIIAGSGLTAPMAWLLGRLTGKPTAVFVYGLDLTTPHPIYRLIWLWCLRRIDTVLAISAPTARLAEAVGISSHKLRIINPGVTLPSLDPLARERFRERLQLGDTPLLLSVGRLTRRKGLLRFVRDIMPEILITHPDTQLIVIGEEPKHALYSQVQRQEEIESVATSLGIADHIRFLGAVTEQELAEAYQAADVHIFPGEEVPNDPEGFGLVAVEAAAHGLQTVAFATGGVIEAVRSEMSGLLIPPDQTRAFSSAVCRLLTTPMPQHNIRAFAESLSWDAFGDRLRDTLEEAARP